MARLGIQKQDLIKWIGRTFLLVALVLCGVGTGVLLSRKLVQENSFTTRTAQKLVRGYGAVFLEGRPHRHQRITNRLTLDVTEYFLPITLKNGAGGISSDGNGGVLIVDLEGKVFHFKDGQTDRLNVSTPRNHSDELRRKLDTGALGSAQVRWGHFRFNDILLHPTVTGQLLLVSFTEWHPDKMCFTSTLAAAKVSDEPAQDWSITAADWAVIARTNPCLKPYTSGFAIRGAEAGGRILSYGPNAVLWTSGAYNRDDSFDRARPETSLAQDDASDYGKVLLVDLVTGLTTKFAKGLRNPQGITQAPDGRIFITDHGMRGGDELNLVREGANFGFPFVTLGTKYSGEPGGLSDQHSGHESFEKPLVSFVPSIAPSSTVFVEDFHPNWDGNILIGDLKRRLHRVYLEGDDVLFVEPIELGLKLRDMVAVGPGEIALFTADKKIAILTPALNADRYNLIQDHLEQVANVELRAAAKGTFDACLECHGLGQAEKGSGPTLFEICGRGAESDPSFAYSGAIASNVDRWSKDALRSFIADPEATAPGTTMAWAGIEQPEVAEIVAEALCQTALLNTSR